MPRRAWLQWHDRGVWFGPLHGRLGRHLLLTSTKPTASPAAARRSSYSSPHRRDSRSTSPTSIQRRNGEPMSQPRPTDPIGSIGWTERTGGVLTARECLTLARPLLRGELSILAGRLAMVLRMHSERGVIDPASLVPPDSPVARCRGRRPRDLDTGTPQPFQSYLYAGAAIAALHGITFDRELLYLAAMFHDTGIPSPVPYVDFTVRSAAWHASYRQPPRACRHPRGRCKRDRDASHPRRWPRIRCRGLPPICRRSRRCVRPTQQ